MAETPTFSGLNPRWYKADQLYRLYVTPDLLCGAYVAGQIRDQQTAALQLQALQLFLGRYIRGLLQRRADLEAKYANMDPCGESFLAADTRNFQIHRRDVVKCTIIHKRRLWTPNNTGTLYVTLASGKRWQFILVGDECATYVGEILRVFCTSIEEIGDPICLHAAERGA